MQQVFNGICTFSKKCVLAHSLSFLNSGKPVAFTRQGDLSHGIVDASVLPSSLDVFCVYCCERALSGAITFRGVIIFYLQDKSGSPSSTFPSRLKIALT